MAIESAYAGVKTLYRHRVLTLNAMAHYKPVDRNPRFLPVVLSEQIQSPVRQVAIFVKNQPSPHAATELMKRAIDSPMGRQLYSQRVGTVEPVFGNIWHNKRLRRFTLRSKAKICTQWNLYCLVHNIEKLAHHGYQ